jgi:hypothetical protein
MGKTQTTDKPIDKAKRYGEKYSPTTLDAICKRIGEGESLRNICREEGMPVRQTVINWVERYPDAWAKYARARDIQADWLFEDMATIEAGVLAGKIDATAGRVVLGSKQWRAGRLAPKKYGDNQRVEVNHTLSETAAQVLKELSQRAKEQRQLIDVTPREVSVEVIAPLDDESNT